MRAFAATAGCGSAWRWSLFGVWMLAVLSPTAYSPAARGATIDVDVFNHRFKPGIVNINVGDTVVWTFRDEHAHNAVAIDSEFDSGPPVSTGTFSYTFTSPGSFVYRCQVHNSMTGTINVSEPAPTEPDLRISATSVSPGTVKTGSSYRIDATVINSGVATSSGTTLTYRLSTNSTISTADAQIGTDPVPELSPGSTSDQTISLTAPALGSHFVGACVDAVADESDTTNQCTPTGLSLTVVPHVLSVLKEGSGTVTSTGGEINCGDTCSAGFANNASVTLNAVPSSGFTFTGWSGACTESSSCNLTLNGDKSVTATFVSGIDSLLMIILPILFE